jgi:hypothetical protein
LVLVVICPDILYPLVLGIYIGTSRPSLDPIGWYLVVDTAPMAGSWMLDARGGSLNGNGKDYRDDHAGGYKQGDRVGMLLDLGDSSLRFFRNGTQHGPGYAAGSVTGPQCRHFIGWCWCNKSGRAQPLSAIQSRSAHGDRGLNLACWLQVVPCPGKHA